MLNPRGQRGGQDPGVSSPTPWECRSVITLNWIIREKSPMASRTLLPAILIPMLPATSPPPAGGPGVMAITVPPGRPAAAGWARHRHAARGAGRAWSVCPNYLAGMRPRERARLTASSRLCTPSRR